MTSPSAVDGSVDLSTAPRVVATPADAAALIATLEQAAWALAAISRLCATSLLDADRAPSTSDEDVAAAHVLVAVGLLTHDGDGFELTPGLAELMTLVPATVRADATTSMVRQIATVTGILPRVTGSGWAANDDETLIAQGRASALGGRMLATIAVGSLAGLAERFRDGGRFLDVGTGVGDLGAAFADALPSANVVGLDVMPRAIELARARIAARRLDDRFEVRLQGIEDLDDVEQYDLAWIPAPFIPPSVFDRALASIHRALRPGGWVVVAAGRLEGDDLGAAVTRWQTVLAGGTAITASDAHAALAGAGFADITSIPTPPGAPAMYSGRRHLRASDRLAEARLT